MIALVFGGSGSGKSSYAEDMICDIAGGRDKYYIATMKVYDEEGTKKIQRHRRLRQGKGFITIEQPEDIDKINIEDAGTKRSGSSKVALLECMSNLVANEMFAEDGIRTCEEVAGKIISGVKSLSDKFDDIVIVSNNVFEDGIQYDSTTMEYIRTMGVVNQKVAGLSEKVTEVVVGIPVELK